MSKFNIDFGELSHRITINEIAISRDVIGGEIIQKTPILTLWAKIEPQKPDVRLSGQVRRIENGLSIYIRYQEAVKKRMIIDLNGDEYEIQSVLNMQLANRWLKLEASKCEGE